jgi:hypothetical protein
MVGGFASRIGLSAVLAFFSVLVQGLSLALSLCKLGGN